MNYLRQSVANASTSLPRPLLMLPYVLLKHLIAFRCGLQPSRVWFRNSLALDYWQFGLSDIDLSILAPTVAEAVRAARMLRWHRRLALGGEAKVYEENSLEHFLPVANPFELRRDPRLRDRVGHTRVGSAEERSYFIFRCLLSDVFLQTVPVLRARRWATVLELVGEPLPTKIDLSSIAEIFLAKSPLSETLTRDELLLEIEDDRGASRPPHLLLFSNRIPWTDPQFEHFKKRLIDEQPRKIHEWLHAAIRWEVWGLYPMTPVLTGTALPQVFQHLRNQRELLNCLQLECSEKEQTLRALGELEIFYEKVERDLRGM